METAGRLLAYLGPEAKERGALEALEKLKGRLGSFATASGGEGEEIGVGGRKGLARALVEGLAALFEQHEVSGCGRGAEDRGCMHHWGVAVFKAVYLLLLG